MIGDTMDKFEYEGYTGKVEIDGRIYTYEGDSLEELQEDFEDIIDSIIAFEDMGDDEEEED